MPEMITGAMFAPVSIALAADDGDSGKLPTFSMVAYTGTEIMQWSWSRGSHRVVLDLASLDVTAKNRPIFLEHSRRDIVGHTTSVVNDGRQVIAKGDLSGVGGAASEVISTSKRGFPWQASVGVAVGSMEEIKAGASVTVNGREFQGPLFVARNGRLSEISFVTLGADDNTDAKIAATAAGGKMGTEDIKAEAPAAVDTVADLRAAAAAEADRLAGIAKVCAAKPDIQASAIREGWTVEAAELAVTKAELADIRAKRPGDLTVIVAKDSPALTTAAIEAALLMGSTVPKALDGFDDQTLSAAKKAFPRGLGLQELFLHYAEQNGVRARSIRGNCAEVIRAAFSNADIAGILGNTSNKALAAGFNMGEMSWREITARRAVNDFKSSTRYRLVGDHSFEKVAPSGEIKSGTLSEESWSNQAATYAKLLSISRNDLINDDLGALLDVPMKLGRGANLKFNEVFWTAFLDNASFFTSGRANYTTGAGTVLGASSLEAVEALFAGLLDDQSKPVGIQPSILLVPSALHVTARQLFTSAEVRDTTASTKIATANVFRDMYRPVASAYLQTTALGGTSTAWYLLASPDIMPVIESVFLFGNETPTIEEVTPDASMLGVTLRGYFDFGCAKAEWRGGVKSKGAA